MRPIRVLDDNRLGTFYDIAELLSKWDSLVMNYSMEYSEKNKRNKLI
jgi:hypothetical protein